MRVRTANFGDIDTGAAVSQMDAIVAQLRSVWDQVNSRWAVLLSQGQADAADKRLSTLSSLIDDLDVGGVARQHVFFPVEGQTQDQAWATWVDTANYIRQGLQQVGGFVSKWSLSSVLPRIAGDIADTASSTTKTLLLVVGGLVALEALRVVTSARRAFSGYRRRRR